MKLAAPVTGVVAVYVVLAGVGVAMATELQVNSDSDRQERGLSIAVAGVGIGDLGEGEVGLSIDIGGPVFEAYLYWSGRDFPCPLDGRGCVLNEPYLDQELIFDGTALTGELIGAERNVRRFGTTNNIGYRADVTTIVQDKGTGFVTFIIQDGNLNSNLGNGIDGAGLLVIYQDEEDPDPYRVIIFDGLDFAFCGARPSAALVARPITFSFAASDTPRSAELALFVGDAKGSAGRPDRIEISGNPSLLDELDGSQGPRWDTDVFSIVIPAGSDKTNVQVISPREFGHCDELLWEVAVLRLPVECIPGETCDDGNACTLGDVCNQFSVCVNVPLDCSSLDTACETISCDPDGFYGNCNISTPRSDCSISDTECLVFSCDPGSGPGNCDIETPINENGPCDDGDACMAGEACQGGECVEGWPVACPDNGDPCTQDLCNPNGEEGNCDITIAVNEGEPCDDVDVCNIGETCQNGTCAGGSPVTCPDNGDPCADDVCDPNGAEGNCEGSVAVNPRGPCDDGLYCTLEDECRAGVCEGRVGRNCDDGSECTVDSCDDDLDKCVNTDANTIACDNVTDCPPDSTDCVGGFCVCVEFPRLCLNAFGVKTDPIPGHVTPPSFDERSTILVDVDMSFSSEPICAAQLFLQYDAAVLEFVSITPGGGVFTTVISEVVDEGAGTIDYLVGANPGSICDGTKGPATAATIEFTAVGECWSEGVCFRGHNPPTLLGAADGSGVCPEGHMRPSGSCGLIDNPIADPCCTEEFPIDSTPPELDCPEIDAFDQSDCGRETRNVTWDPVVAFDNCDGEIPVTCDITHNDGAGVFHLLEGGGDFPRGTTTIDCLAVDSAENSTSCTFSVQNKGKNRLYIDVELSPPMDPGPFTRGIEIMVSDCIDLGRAKALDRCVDVAFGAPDNTPGRGVADTLLPPGNYLCIEARDPLHTLTATCELTCEYIPGIGEVWYAAFEDSESLGDSCHWLIGGNLNGFDDGGVIDQIDTDIHLDQLGGSIGADTPCGAKGPHADINGDGVVDAELDGEDYLEDDKDFIDYNFSSSDEVGCEAVCNAFEPPP